MYIVITVKSYVWHQRNHIHLLFYCMSVAVSDNSLASALGEQVFNGYYPMSNPAKSTTYADVHSPTTPSHSSNSSNLINMLSMTSLPASVQDAASKLMEDPAFFLKSEPDFIPSQKYDDLASCSFYSTNAAESTVEQLYNQTQTNQAVQQHYKTYPPLNYCTLPKSETPINTQQNTSVGMAHYNPHVGYLMNNFDHQSLHAQREGVNQYMINNLHSATPLPTAQSNFHTSESSQNNNTTIVNATNASNTTRNNASPVLPSSIVFPTISIQQESTVRSDESEKQLSVVINDAKAQYSDITKLLNMQQNQAAKQLGIPTSTLSKRWREAAPHRKWPWRTVSKIDKEITTLLHNIPTDGVMPKDIEAKLSVLLSKRQEELKPIVIRIN